MADKYESYPDSLTSPPRNGFIIDPSDTANFSANPYTRAISVNASGIVALVMPDDTILPQYIAAGSQFSVRAKRVNLTGTDSAVIAAGLNGWW